MILMKVETPYLDEAEKVITELQEFKDNFKIAQIDYTLGKKVDFAKHDSWPLKFWWQENGKICRLVEVAIATAGYKGAGPLFTYNALQALGFNPGKEIFEASGEHVKLEYRK